MVSGFNNGAVTVDDAATSRTNLGITNIATQSVTQFDTLVGAASNGITSIAPGTAGQVLTSGGAGANPAYANGGWVLIQTQATGTGATLAFNTGITSTYDAYAFVFKNVVSAAATTRLQVQVATDGVTFINTGYLSGINTAVYTSATYTNLNNTTSFLLSPNVGTNASLGINGVVYFTGVTSGQDINLSGVLTATNSTPAPVMVFTTGQLATASINAFQFSWTAGGNFTSGNISLYGIRQ